MTLILCFIVFFTIIIVHELGHFIAAKLCKIHVAKFSIGFPPKIVSKTWKDTEYCISLLPLGGTVEIPELESNDIPHYKKHIIFMSGSILIFVFSWFIFFCTFHFVGSYHLDTSNKVGQILPNQPAEKAGIHPGDRIIQINDHEIKVWKDYQRIIRQYPKQRITVTWSRNDSAFVKEMIPMIWICPFRSETKEITTLGIAPELTTYKPNVSESFFLGARRLCNACKNAVSYIFRLFTGRDTLKKLRGPVGFFQMIKANLKNGLNPFLYLVAVISIYLGIINLLPIPGLDGGSMLLVSIEGVRRKHFSKKNKLIIEAIGLVFLLCILIYVTINDISKL